MLTAALFFKEERSLFGKLGVAYMQLSVQLIRNCMIYRSMQMLFRSIGISVLKIVYVIVVTGD